MAVAIQPSDVVGVIKQLFPDASSPGYVLDKRTSADRLAALLELISFIPLDLVSETGRLTDYITNLASLREAQAAWRALQNPPVAPLKGSHQSPVAVLRSILEQTPPTSIPRDTPEFPFLKGDPSWRDELRRDVAEAERAILATEWKAATVMAGSVIEALLLWALDRPAYRKKAKTAPGIPNAPIDRWHLPQYIAAASHCGLLGAETLKECEASKEYRDLIHPGKAQRVKRRPDRGTARTALAAVEHVSAELTKRFPGPRSVP